MTPFDSSRLFAASSLLAGWLPLFAGCHVAKPAPPPAATSHALAYEPTAEEFRHLAQARELAPRGPLFIIFLDAAGAYHFGCYGYERDTSPNIDAFARDGVIFERAITPYPNTHVAFWAVSASRWSRPAEGALHPPIFGAQPAADPTNSFPALMREKGYFSLGASANWFATTSWRGFDVFQRLFDPPKKAGDWPREDRCPAFLPQVSKWIDAYASREPRLFFWLHYLEPHAPYDTPAPFNTRFTPGNPASTFGRDAYDNNVSFVDHEIGNLMRFLKERDIYDSATLILTADHGEAWAEHGTMFHNTGVHDEEARVPLIIKFPKGAAPLERRVAAPVSTIDLMPTLADLYSIDCDQSRWSGASLLPLVFTRQPKTHEYVFCRAGLDPEDKECMKRLGMPIPHQPVAEKAQQEHPNNFYSIRDERYLLTWQLADGAVHLYDMLLDPRERFQIAERKPAVRDRMLAVLKRWREEAPLYIREKGTNR